MSEPEKILLLSVAHQNGSGAERVLEYFLAGSDEALRKRLLVAAPADSSTARLAQSLELQWIDWRASRDSFAQNALAAMRCRQELRKHRVALVHAWTARGLEWAWLLASLLGARAVGTLHDHPAAHFHGKLRRRLIRLFVNRLAAYACVSEALKETYLSAGYSQKAQVIRNGLPVLEETAESKSAKAPTPFAIGFLGMGFSWKGFPIIEKWIDATTELDVQWHLYGKENQWTHDIKQRLLERHSERVHFHGRRKPSEIFPRLDLALNPSTRFDPLPTVLIEAAQYGVPALATDAGGSVEIIQHGRTGFLFPADQPQKGLEIIKELVASSEKRLNLGRQARKRFESEFTIERMTQEYEALWNDLP